MTHDYRLFTQPAELHKAINTLRGIVSGLSTDRKVDNDEIQELVHWVSLHEHLRNCHPFSEILPTVEAACEDNIISAEEADDILWVCASFADSGSYYDSITSSIQFLMGLVHGIMADAELSDSEIYALRKWIDSNSYLASTYPFDEINSLLVSIMSDKKIEQHEREMLMAFFSTIIEFNDSLNLHETDFEELRKTYSISGICAICPDIIFEGKSFIFTGESYRASRPKMAEAVLRHGGKVTTKVSGQTDYLIVGSEGNPCWKFSCYGKKISDAIAFRSNGAKVQIVHENDFWDAVDDADMLK